MTETIGSRIRALREAAKLSRRELARDAGIATTTLSDLELGYSHTTTALHRIAKRLGVSIEELETGHGSRIATYGRAGVAEPPTITAIIEDLAIVLATVPEGLRPAVGKMLDALSNAPDDASLHSSLTQLLETVARRA